MLITIYSVYYANDRVFSLSRRCPCIRSITPLSVYSIYNAVIRVFDLSRRCPCVAVRPHAVLHARAGECGADMEAAGNRSSGGPTVPPGGELCVSATLVPGVVPGGYP